MEVKTALEYDTDGRVLSGLYQIPAKDYHAVPGYLSFSGLKHFHRSAAHYQTYLKEPHSQTDDRRIGSAVDTMVFTPQEYNSIIKICGERRGKDERALEDSGLITLKPDQDERVRIISEEVRMKMERMEITGFSQASLFLVDPDTGCPLKGRPDLINLEAKTIYDLKTTDYADEPTFRKTQLFKNRYHWQAAMYLLLCSVYYGVKFEHYKIIAAETDPPFGVNVIEIGEATIEKALEIIVPKFQLFHDCLQSGEWPCYADLEEITEIDLY